MKDWFRDLLLASKWELARRAAGALLWLMVAFGLGLALMDGGGLSVAAGALLLWGGYRTGTSDVEDLRQALDRIKTKLGGGHDSF